MEGADNALALNSLLSGHVRHRLPKGGGTEQMELQTRRYKAIYIILTLSVVTFLIRFESFPIPCAVAAEERQSQPSGLFFCQGRAVVDPQNQAESRREALDDFLSQAVSQAVARIFSPSQMETYYAALKETIFKQAERYVQNYQVFSEGMERGDFYQITGQVQIEMEALERDLVHFETFHGTEPQEESTPSPDPSDTHYGISDEHGKSAVMEEGESSGADGKTILWAVAERWDRGWHVPVGRMDAQGIFAANVLQEMKQFGWSLEYPPEGVVVANDKGAADIEQVFSAAKDARVNRAVTGSISVREDHVSGLRLSTTLVVHDVISRKKQGEIHKELSVDAGSTMEGAMELAAFVVPQLERLLRGEFTEVETHGPDRQELEDRPTPSKDGDLVLRIRSGRPQADWEEIEKIMREKAGSLKIEGLEFGREGGLVHLHGVDESVLESLKDIRLKSGAGIQINGPSSDGREVVLTVVYSEPPQ